MASVSNFTGGLEAHHGGAETKITNDVPGEHRPSVHMRTLVGLSATPKPRRCSRFNERYGGISYSHQHTARSFNVR
jgi:hypothetical protein